MLCGGVARVDITPPVPIDLVGYSRRWQPATEIRGPLTATALVIDDGERRAVIVALDLPILRPDDADALRERIAAAAGADPDCVLVNVSHTHAGPHTSMQGIKIGGNQRGHSENEIEYIAALAGRIAGAAALAAGRLEPVRVAGGSGSFDLGVNRREPGPDGRIILGWNPDGVRDTDVGVIVIARDDGTPLALLVNYACHPVVVGPDDSAINPDFPGPMRDLVEQVTGATCLFLQGAAGDVLPLEGFHDSTGPEVTFGRLLGIEAIHIASGIETHEIDIEKHEFGSVTPISLYRKVRRSLQQPQLVRVSSARAELPLKRVPTDTELKDELGRYRTALEEARDAGAGAEQTNPLEYHVNWAEEALRQVRAGEARPEVSAFLQVIRIGDIAVVAVPGEVFSEIALEVKRKSPAAVTLFTGYSNGIISYLPTAAAYPLGGYEVDYAHHSYGLVEQVGPETEAILTAACAELLSQLW